MTAVAAAQAAFAGWRSVSGRERGVWLDGFAKGLTQRLPALVELQMLNNGKPRGEAETDVRDAIATFEYYADLAARLDEEQNSKVPLPDSGYSGKTRFEPLGPIGMIVPWNFPLVTSAWKVAPALAAGCTGGVEDVGVHAIRGTRLRRYCSGDRTSARRAEYSHR
jgi:betaine-aldehyde dehydrogenase